MQAELHEANFKKWLKQNAIDAKSFTPPSYATQYDFERLRDSLMHECAGCGRKISQNYEKCRKCSYDNQGKPKVQ